MACIICNSPISICIFQEEDIDILRCQKCGHVYSSFISPADYDGYFSQDILFSDKSWWDKGHRRMFKSFRDLYLDQKDGRLLDVGSGLGYFIKSIQDDSKTANWKAEGVEISIPAVKFAREELGLDNIFCGRLADASYLEHTYDWITLWDVIEHLANPRPMLSDIKSLLAPGGCLFITTPNINIQLPKARLKHFLSLSDGHSLEARDHLQDYSPRSIRKLLESEGFNQIRFIILPPISLVSGHSGFLAQALKEAWYQITRLIFYLSGKKLNFNNIYVIASLK